MENLLHIVNTLDEFFAIGEWGEDPAFSRFLPAVYDASGYPWKDVFEPAFCVGFNGLMLKGQPSVPEIFCAAFPSDEVLRTLLEHASPGALLFVHHPIDMRCGSPETGDVEGFIPIDPEVIEALSRRGISVYACHAPLDCHPTISTSGAIVQALGGEILGRFLPYGSGYAGIYCKITRRPYGYFLEELKNLFEVPILDVGGNTVSEVETIAVVAGGGDRAAEMEQAQKFGCDAYLTGHIRHFVDNELYRQRREAVEQWFSAAAIPYIGVSHPASEHLVMKTQIKELFEERFSAPVHYLSETSWWR